MIDFHSHILPGVDDGSADTAESLALLEESGRQGIEVMAATPHFYAWEQTPQRFLQRRAEAAQRLRAVMHPGLPRVLLGAEVCYFEGISRAEGMDALRLEGTPLLLVEMPFAPWSGRVTAEIKALSRQDATTVVLAHIERYLSFVEAPTWRALLDSGVLFQCNAGFFLRLGTRHTALRLVREGWVHFLGSDCHNLAHRPPRLGKALDRLGQAERQMLQAVEKRYFPDPAEK